MPNTTPKGNVIVTGSAAKGIGRAIAFRLAKDGFNVAVNDLPSRTADLEQLAKDIEAKYPGRRAIAIPGDVSDEVAVRKIVDDTVAILGGLDVMVANAAAFTVDPLTKSTLDAFMRIQSVNVGGTFLCYREAARVMIAAGKGGRIIGASSAAGKQGTPFCPGYSASKGAIRSLTQSSATELAPHKITVNAYAPGVTNTDLAHSLDEDFKAVMGLSFSELGTVAAPMHRVGEPEEIANFVSWLASSESSFMTGQTVSVNGGLFFD